MVMVVEADYDSVCCAKCIYDQEKNTGDVVSLLLHQATSAAAEVAC